MKEPFSIRDIVMSLQKLAAFHREQRAQHAEKEAFPPRAAERARDRARDHNQPAGRLLDAKSVRPERDGLLGVHLP
jgi:hypothetical protein